MNRAVKFLLIVALGLILIVGALFVGVMAKHNWDLASLSKDDYETRSYPVTEDFRSIDIRSDTENISFVPSDDGTCRVEITEKKEEPHTVTVKDGTLRIEKPKDEGWSISFFSFSFSAPKITVYLPKTEYAALFIEESTGKIDIPADFRFERIDVTAETGDVDCRASASASIGIRTSTGDISLSDLSAGTIGITVSTGRVELRGIACEGELNVQVSTGRAELTDVSCGSLVSYGSTGSLRMKNLIASGSLTVERSTGDVRMEACDAAELEIGTDTGDVTGSLRSDKVFLVSSDTGRIRVPESVTGGKCKITTDTGDITVSIEGN